MTVLEVRIPDITAVTELAEAPSGSRTIPLAHGRHLSLAASGGDDLVEIRGAGDVVELRIRMTADGPVLQMESLRLSLKAAQDVEVDCANFAVRARETMTMQSDGALHIKGEADVHLDANGDVRVKGSMIYLN